MDGHYYNHVLLYIITIIIACLCVALAVCFCVFLIRRKRKSKTCYGDLDQRYEAPIEMKEEIGSNSLLFVFDTKIERQQSPPLLLRSCPNSPGEYNDNKTLASNMNLVQPRLSDGMINLGALDLKMYQDEAKATQLYGGYGRLLLSFCYNRDRQLLTVKVHQGEDFLSKSNNSTISPYLKVCLLPDKKRRMHSKTKKGDSPVFEEEFSFSVAEHNLKQRALRIVVCDFDRFSRQTVLGYVVVSVRELACDEMLYEEGTQRMWKYLSDNDSIPGVNKGQLLFSITHLPTAHRITITVIEAKELFINTEKDVGISVKVNLIMSDKVIKSKKTSLNKSGLESPVFNESFVFEIENEIIGQINFALIVYVYNNNGKRVVGKTTTGPYFYSFGTGLEQWDDMLSKPRKAISRWHTLV